MLRLLPPLIRQAAFQGPAGSTGGQGIQGATGAVGVSVLFCNDADSASIASVAVATDFSVTYSGLGAGYFAQGKMLRVTASGLANWASGTMGFNLLVGDINFTGPVFAPSGGQPFYWRLQLITRCRTTGAGGTFSRDMNGTFNNAGGAVIGSGYAGVGQVASDTTINKIIKAQFVPSVSAAGNNATLHQLLVEALN